MVSTSTKHFRTYQPRPFTKEERGDVTILFGGLHWRAERLIQGSLTRLGYKTQILPPATKADLLTGRAVADIGQCCPTSFTTGNTGQFFDRGSAEVESRGGSGKIRVLYRRFLRGMQIRPVSPELRACTSKQRHGPADLLAGAADRGALRDIVLLVSGSRFHQTHGLGENSRRDDQLLPGKALCRHHGEEKRRKPARLSVENRRTRFYDFSGVTGVAPVSGRISGNSSTSLMDGESVSNITRRSMPIPSPAVGGRAYSSARM